MLFFVYAASLGDDDRPDRDGIHRGLGRVGVRLRVSDVRRRRPIYGHVTKRSLARIGSLLYMALFGLLVAIVINLFLRSDAASFVISIVGVVLFTGLTAWDVQRIQNGRSRGLHRVDEKAAVMGALNLYLDFVNLFLFMLRLFGARD